MRPKLNPPTIKLIEEILKENSNATSREISAYVCEKQGRNQIMLSGTQITKVKEKLGIPINEKMRRRNHTDEQTPVNKVSNKKRMYIVHGVIEGTLVRSYGQVLKIIAEKTGVEVIQTVNPDVIEIREHARGGK